MQETQVWYPVREDPMCHGATKPVYNSWACTLERESRNYRAHVPQLLKPAHPRAWAPQQESHCNEKPAHCNQSTAPAQGNRREVQASVKTQQSQKERKKEKKTVCWHCLLTYNINVKTQWCPVFFFFIPWRERAFDDDRVKKENVFGSLTVYQLYAPGVDITAIVCTLQRKHMNDWKFEGDKEPLVPASQVKSRRAQACLLSHKD